MYRTAFPDLHITFEDLIAEGDVTAARFTSRGTHQGPFMGLSPMGKQVTGTGSSITPWANGKEEEVWLNFDALRTCKTSTACGIP